jgi:hypothetical protein
VMKRRRQNPPQERGERVPGVCPGKERGLRMLADQRRASFSVRDLGIRTSHSASSKPRGIMWLRGNLRCEK